LRPGIARGAAKCRKRSRDSKLREDLGRLGIVGRAEGKAATQYPAPSNQAWSKGRTFTQDVWQALMSVCTRTTAVTWANGGGVSDTGWERSARKLARCPFDIDGVRSERRPPSGSLENSAFVGGRGALTIEEGTDTRAGIPSSGQVMGGVFLLQRAGRTGCGPREGSRTRPTRPRKMEGSAPSFWAKLAQSRRN